MPLQLSHETIYVGLVSIGSLFALALGVYALLPDESPVTLVREFLGTDWKYLGVAWVITFSVNTLAKYHVDTMFTDSVYALEGTTVAMFQVVTAPSLTLFFSIVYLVGFPFIVLFTYFKLKAHDENEAYRYALAYVCLVLLATPFFVLTPVRVVAHTVPQVDPLLYSMNPVVQAGVAATDTLTKALPSLHTGLSLMAALYARQTDARYARLAWVMALSIVVSTFYLGIHWLTDAVVATILVLVAYWLSRQVEDPQRMFPIR